MYQANVAWALVRQEEETPSRKAKARQKTLREAESRCRQALQVDPEFPQAHGCLGVIAYKQDRFEEAEECFLRSIAADRNEGSYSDLAALYMQAGRYNDARKQLRLALEIEPDDVQAHIELGNLYWKENNKKKAIRELRRAAMSDPAGYEGPRALAIALLQAGESTEAESVLRRTIRRLKKLGPSSPGRWRLHLALSQVLRSRADRSKDKKLYEEAHSEVRAALAQTEHTEAYFELGLVLASLEDYKGALKAFRECHALDESHFEASRNADRVETILSEMRLQLQSSAKGGRLIAVLAFVQAVGVWIIYLYGLIQESTLLVLIPILLGLGVVGVLLPSLTRFKLPGLEAEMLSERRQPISAGPTVGFTVPPITGLPPPITGNP